MIIIMENDRVIDEVTVTDSPCEIKLQFIERQDGDNTVYVVRYMVGGDDPKETISRDRDYIENAFINCKLVIL
jgi:hypothetical protein